MLSISESFCLIAAAFTFDYILSLSDPTELSNIDHDHFVQCFGEHDFIHMKQFSFHFKGSLVCILLGPATALSPLVPLSFKSLTSLGMTLSVYVLYNMNFCGFCDS